MYLGHVVNAAGVSPESAKLRVFSTWPTPETVRDVQSFLGVINFYGKFIPNSTHLTAPLSNLTVGKKGTDKVTLNADELAVSKASNAHSAPALSWRTPAS